MPYEWTVTAPDEFGAVSHRLRLWPYRSLPPRGFVWFIGITATLLALPALAVVGTAVMWGLLPFLLLTIWAVWAALQRTYRSGRVFEQLDLTHARLSLDRYDPGRPSRHWQANPYWIRVTLRPGPVEDYLTLSDGQREVELGAFLTPEERRSLGRELQHKLVALRSE